jgi:hypothetical protein
MSTSPPIEPKLNTELVAAIQKEAMEAVKSGLRENIPLILAEIMPSIMTSVDKRIAEALTTALRDIPNVEQVSQIVNKTVERILNALETKIDALTDKVDASNDKLDARIRELDDMRADMDDLEGAVKEVGLSASHNKTDIQTLRIDWFGSPQQGGAKGALPQLLEQIEAQARETRIQFKESITTVGKNIEDRLMEDQQIHATRILALEAGQAAHTEQIQAMYPRELARQKIEDMILSVVKIGRTVFSDRVLLLKLISLATGSGFLIWLVEHIGR